MIDATLPLGHGAALMCPDLPYLKWHYLDGNNTKIKRDNPKIFMEAVKCIFESLVKYRIGDSEAQIKEQIKQSDQRQINSTILNLTDDNEFVRHQHWLRLIAGGIFSFGPEIISYVAKGQGSWKSQALNTENEDDSDEYKYSESFLSSNWKMFHDALQKHQFEVIHDILPKFGICVS